MAMRGILDGSTASKTILFLIDGLAGGGAEAVVLRQAGAMVARAHRVILVSLSAPRDYPVPDGIEFVQLQDNYHGPLHRQTEIARRAASLDRMLRARFQPGDIDLAISNLPKCDRIVAATPFLRDAWFCLHNALIKGQLEARKGLQRWLKQYQLRHTYSGRKLITVSQALQEDVHACGIRPLRMTTIHNPFDISAIRRLAQQPCGFEGESFLLHVGRFHRQKRHDRLLAAFCASGYPGKLLLLGQGNARQEQQIRLQAEQLGIADRVVMPGFVANPFAYMRAADALVLSSDHEGFGNCLAEALICGTPVISTDCPHGPREILTGELARGLCLPDVADLARTIREILARPPLIRHSDLERFELNAMVDAYLNLITTRQCRVPNPMTAPGFPVQAEELLDC
jgi:glycosyltransferase involved in cell wall biosynthesis